MEAYDTAVLNMYRISEIGILIRITAPRTSHMQYTFYSLHVSDNTLINTEYEIISWFNISFLFDQHNFKKIMRNSFWIV